MMITTRHAIGLRLNGLLIEQLKIRAKLIEGVPSQQLEVLIKDPVLGELTLHEGFDMEINIQDGLGWKKLQSVEQLLALIPAPK